MGKRDVTRLRLMRIQFDIPEQKAKELDEIMRLSGLSTRKDLFNNALSLFEWALRESRAGRSIASVDEEQNSYKQLVMAALMVPRKVKEE